MKIHEITNFVRPEICEKIIQEISNTRTRPHRETTPFFHNRTQNINSFESKTELNKISQQMLNLAKILYRQDNLVIDYVDIVTWFNGQQMGPHSDSVNIQTGKPYDYCGSRVYSGVLYLNDNYKGGETYFTNKNIDVKPQQGKLVLFPADVEYSHGVRPVVTQNGNCRHTMPIWFKEI